MLNSLRALCLPMLCSLEKKAREYTNELGQTGEGIYYVHQVDQTESNTFTNKVGQSLTHFAVSSLLSYALLDVVLAKFPWYFKIKRLIAQRPNAKPIRLGNNQSEVDASVLGAETMDTDQVPSGPGSVFGPGVSSKEASEVSADELYGVDSADHACFKLRLPDGESADQIVC